MMPLIVGVLAKKTTAGEDLILELMQSNEILEKKRDVRGDPQAVARG